MNKLFAIFLVVPMYPVLWLWCGFIGWCVIERRPCCKEVTEVANRFIRNRWRGEQ